MADNYTLGAPLCLLGQPTSFHEVFNPDREGINSGHHQTANLAETALFLGPQPGCRLPRVLQGQDGLQRVQYVYRNFPTGSSFGRKAVQYFTEIFREAG